MSFNNILTLRRNIAKIVECVTFVCLFTSEKYFKFDMSTLPSFKITGAALFGN